MYPRWRMRRWRAWRRPYWGWGWRRRWGCFPGCGLVLLLPTLLLGLFFLTWIARHI